MVDLSLLLIVIIGYHKLERIGVLLGGILHQLGVLGDFLFKGRLVKIEGCQDLLWVEICRQREDNLRHGCVSSYRFKPFHDGWVEYSLGKLLHLEREELVLYYSVPKSKLTLFVIFEISELLHVKRPYVSQKVFVYVVIAIPTWTILWLVWFKMDAALELLGYLDELKLTDVGVTATGKFPEILLVADLSDLLARSVKLLVWGSLAVVILFHQSVVNRVAVWFIRRQTNHFLYFENWVGLLVLVEKGLVYFGFAYSFSLLTFEVFKLLLQPRNFLFLLHDS